MKVAVKIIGVCFLMCWMLADLSAQIETNPLKRTPFPSQLPKKTKEPTQTSTPKTTVAEEDNILRNGRKLLGEANYEEAVREFTRIIGENPNFAEAYLQRAIAYGQLGKIRLARDDAQKTISLSPKNARAFNVLGKTFADEKLFVQAVESYTKALLIRSDFATAYNNRGFAYLSQNKTDFAILDFTNALKFAKKPAEALNYYENRGIAYSLKQDLTNAVKDFTSAIIINPNRAKSYQLRASVYRQQGFTERAEADLETAQKLNGF
jgi:tetratricopeptide (TPR) repeat protein